MYCTVWSQEEFDLDPNDRDNDEINIIINCPFCLKVRAIGCEPLNSYGDFMLDCCCIMGVAGYELIDSDSQYIDPWPGLEEEKHDLSEYKYCTKLNSLNLLIIMKWKTTTLKAISLKN